MENLEAYAAFAECRSQTTLGLKENIDLSAAITAKRSGSTLATKPESVVVPGKVATPHDTMGEFVEANRVLDATTSPAVYSLPNNQVALATIYMRFLTITVKDQFGDLIGDIYKDAVVTETIGTATFSINQKLTSSSTYLDPVGQLEPNPNGSVVPKDDPEVAAWPSAPKAPLTPQPDVSSVFPVQVDGFVLDPGLGGRKFTSTLPNIITITWP